MERIVDIATDKLHLCAYRGFLRVEQDHKEIGHIPLEDIHALIIHAYGVTWTTNLVACLAEIGAPIVFCGTNHQPIAVTLPLDGHHTQAARMRAQWEASKPLCKQLWRMIVSAKIEMQGALLSAYGIPGAAAFSHLARRVSSGDRENLEAQAARRYWPLLMGKRFRRDQNSEGANALLNYGYTILRSSCARAVVAAGLHPTIGIQHSNRGNAFALADDLVEPFRPLVDALVFKLAQEKQTSLTPDIKHRFAKLISFDLRISGAISPVSVAANRLAQSLARAFETGRPQLSLFTPPTDIEWAAIGNIMVDQQ